MSGIGNASDTEIYHEGRLAGWLSAARGYVVVLLPLAVLMLLLAVHFNETRNRAYMAELRANITDRLDTQRARIESRVVGLSLMLRGLEAAIEADPNIPASRYDALARFMIRDNPEILNIAAAPGLVVKYVYPAQPNGSIVGFDYRKGPADQLASVETARSTGQAVVAGPLPLLQNGRMGYIIRLPVFLHDETTGAGPDGTFWGILSLVIDAETLYRQSGLLDQPGDISIALRGAGGTGAKGPVFLGDPAVFDNAPLVQTISLPYGSWQIAAIPRGGWPSWPPNTELVWLAMVAIGALVLGATGLILHLMHRHHRARDQLLSAISAIDDGFALYDAQDKLVLCNDHYRDLYNRSGDLIKPGNRFEYMIREGVRRGQYPRAIGREEEWIAERLAAHRRADTRIEQQLSDGRWLRIAERRTADGSTVGFRVDITELKRAKESAEAANRLKADFLSVLSHELRTPLTVILGFARFLSDRRASATLRRLAMEEGSLDPAEFELLESYIAEVTHRAARIETSGGHLLTLINDLLDFSKIEAGKMDLEREDLALEELVADVNEQLGVKAETKGLALLSDVGGLRVHADAVRLRQVLINLVGNAIKFTDSGQIVVRAAPAEENEGLVAVSVSDTGCGIPAEMTDSVFKEFQQADSSSTRRAGGTGLGLAISRRIVEMHGGRIGVTSIEGEGSTFTFTMPVATSAPDAPAKSAA